MSTGAGTNGAAVFGQVTNPGDTPIITTVAGRIKASVAFGSANGDGASSVYPIMTDGDYAGGLMIGPWLFNGASWDRQRTPNVYKTVAAVAVTAGTPVTIWTPAAGKKFRLMGFHLGTTVAAGIILLDNAAEVLRVLASAGVSFMSPELDNGYLSTAANNPLKVNVTVTGNVSGFVYGTEE